MLQQYFQMELTKIILSLKSVISPITSWCKNVDSLNYQEFDNFALPYFPWGGSSPPHLVPRLLPGSISFPGKSLGSRVTRLCLVWYKNAGLTLPWLKPRGFLRHCGLNILVAKVPRLTAFTKASAVISPYNFLGV